MIYIEVIFGAINGNALDVDSALSLTSTNPVQNKVIAAALDLLQRNIDAVAGSITKDVVEVATYDDLAEIEEPRTDVIYVTTDTEKLYLYDADTEEFNEVTSTEVDNTIYVTNLDALFDKNLDAGMYAVSYTKRAIGGPTTTMYSLSVSTSSRRTVVNGRPAVVRTTNMILANANGYAVKVEKENIVEVETYDDLADIEEPDAEIIYVTTDTNKRYMYDAENDEFNEVSISLFEWVWTLYSVEGHTHTVSEISGLAQAIIDATVNKQDKTDNGFNTSSKTVVGAVNEVHDELNGLVHAFTIDFQDTREIVQMHTFVGQKLTHIKTSNVSTLKLSINGSQQTIQLTNGEWTGEITIASGALLVWQIGRTSEGSIAEISVQYQYNS